ncbi:MAG: DUF998 domain-containing protein [Anaerolineales bacterium]
MKTLSTKPNLVIHETASSLSLTTARLTLYSAVLFIVLLAALHLIKPELDPSWRMISEYEIGNFGWIMRLAFFLLAGSCITLFIALYSQVRGFWGKFGLGLLLLSATGMILAGIFTSDSMTGSRTPTGQIHELGAMLDSIPFAALFINLTLIFKNPNWASARKALWWTAFLPLLGLVTFVGSVVVLFPSDGKFGPDVLTGWQNRFFILTHAIWLTVIAKQALKVYEQKA